MILLIFILFTITIYISVFWALVYISNIHNFDDPKPKKVPSISILIPAFNEEKNIADTIKSCLRLNYPKRKLRIIVIDDGSTDNTYNIAKSFEKTGIVKVLTKKNGGKSSALNLGLKHCKSELVMTLDADSEIHPDSLKTCLGYFSDPKLAILTPSVLIKEPKNIIEKVQWVEYLYAVFLRKIFSFIDCQYIAPGPGSIFRRSFFEKEGGFEVDNLTEDMEIGLRAIERGYKIKNSLNLRVYTKPPSNIKTLKKQRVRWYRGTIDNQIKYKHMILNPKYGDISLFLFFSIIVIVSLLFSSSYSIIKFLSGFVRKVFMYSRIDYDIIPMMDFSFSVSRKSLLSFLIDLNYTLFFLGIIGTCIGIFGLLCARKKQKEYLIGEKTSSYLFYVLFYFLLIFAFWVEAIIKNMIGREKKW